MGRQDAVFHERETVWLRSKLEQADLQAILAGDGAEKCKDVATLIWQEYLETFKHPLPAETELEFNARYGNARNDRKPYLWRKCEETQEDVEKRKAERLQVRQLSPQIGHLYLLNL